MNYILGYPFMDGPFFMMILELIFRVFYSYCKIEIRALV